ncbi:MAG TPA: hypothetical protein VJ783_14165 [Pirellulales bacterium]|nr:hypothetical protein [Pirellulales bacterium]
MMSLRAVFLVVAVSASGSATAGAVSQESATEHRTYRAGAWNVVETTNFRFCSHGRLALSAKTLGAAEDLREQLFVRWSGKPSGQNAWRPKCDIILHGTAAAYLRSVPGGEQTLGSSLIDVEGDKVVGRRIDIRADQPGWFNAALGHELTHIVLADLFSGSRVPAWADEGMAVLADPSGKQDGHLRDLRMAQLQRTSFRLVELLALDDYPQTDRHAAFYGQSASLVQYLVERGTPEQFVRFIRSGAASGYEQALRDTYRINGVTDLEHRWRQHVNAIDSLAVRERRIAVD